MFARHLDPKIIKWQPGLLSDSSSQQATNRTYKISGIGTNKQETIKNTPTALWLSPRHKSKLMANKTRLIEQTIKKSLITKKIQTR